MYIKLSDVRDFLNSLTAVDHGAVPFHSMWKQLGHLCWTISLFSWFMLFYEDSNKDFTVTNVVIFKGKNSHRFQLWHPSPHGVIYTYMQCCVTIKSDWGGFAQCSIFCLCVWGHSQHLAFKLYLWLCHQGVYFNKRMWPGPT